MHSTHSMVKLASGKILRESDIAIKDNCSKLVLQSLILINYMKLDQRKEKRELIQEKKGSSLRRTTSHRQNHHQKNRDNPETHLKRK